MKKKIFMMVMFTIMMFSFVTPVFAANISSCDTIISTSVMIDERIPEIVHLIIMVIKIAVPILLVIFGSIDLVKGITAQKEDEIKKGRQTFVKRLIFNL